MTHKHADLIKNFKNNLNNNISISKFVKDDSFRPLVKVEFVLSSEDIQDIISLHDDSIVSQIIGSSVISAIKNQIY